MEKVKHERFAAQLLLAGPTDLNRAWANSDDNEIEKNVAAQLDRLDLSEEERDAVKDFALTFAAVRNVFKGVADSLKVTLYSGSEPHPSVAQANAIIRKLRELD